MERTNQVRALFEAIEAKNHDKVQDLLSDDFTFSGAVPKPVGKKDWTDLHKALQSGIPDLKFNIHDIKEEGDKVIAKVRLEGTHTNTLSIPSMNLNIEASENKIRLPEETVEVRFRGNKIQNINVRVLPDGGVKGILKQIGAEVPEIS